jgi:membrane protein
VKFCAPFWEYRLGSMLVILGAVMLLMIAFAASAALTFAHHLLIQWFPFAQDIATTLGLYRLVPAATLFFTFYVLFYVLTPSRYRTGSRKWPGALFITAWWLVTVELLPNALSLFGGYGRTYGSLAGVMIALIFFFVVGLGVVIGAELNAALAEGGATALKGEVYTGPYTDELEVEEPQPGEDVEPVLQMRGQQL